MSNKNLNDHIDLAYYYAINAYNKYPYLLSKFDIEEIEAKINKIVRIRDGECSLAEQLDFDPEQEVLQLLKDVRTYVNFLKRTYEKAR
jgi:RAB protein geranylgeranyltransferase component A